MDIFDQITDKKTDIFDRITGGGDIFDDIAPGEQAGLTKPAPELAKDIMSQIVGLDRPKPAPFKQTHPALYATGKTVLDMPSLIEQTAMSVVSGATFSLPERATEAGEWLSRKLFGEGRKGGATGTWKEKPQLHPYVKTAGKFTGSMINVGALGRGIAAPIISTVTKHKHFVPFARMIGWGAAGGAYRTGEQLFDEGELPTPKEIVKHGALWASIEGIMSSLGWTGRLAIGLNRLSKLWTIPRKEVLKTVLKEAKLRNMPFARYIYAKAGTQKALSAKEIASTQGFLDVIDDLVVPFKKQGTYQSLVEQLKNEEVVSRVKLFDEYVGKYPGERIQWTRKMGKDIRLTKPISREDKLYGVLLKTKEKPAKIVVPAIKKTPETLAKLPPITWEYNKRFKKNFAIPDKKFWDWYDRYPGQARGLKKEFGIVLDKSQKGEWYLAKPIIAKKKILPAKPETIMLKSAALKFSDGTIIAGQTHADAYNKAFDRGFRKQLDRIEYMSGFVDDSGKFLTRIQTTKKYGLRTSEELITKKKGTTLGFGPTGYLQNIYEKLMAGRLHRSLKKKLGDAIPHKLSADAQIVIDALRKVKPLSIKQREIYSIERGNRLADAIKLRGITSGEHGYHAELKALEGRMEHKTFEPVRKLITQKTVNSLMNEIRDCPVLSNWETYPARKALAELLQGSIPTEGGQTLLRDVFGKKFIDALSSNRALWLKIKGAGIIAVNFPKAIKSSYDLSAPLRQGIFMIRRFRQWLPAFRDMFKYFGSKEAYHEAALGIRRHHNYRLAKENKLSLTDLGKITTREEAFQSSWAEKIPGVGASAQAYTGFLNQFRFNVFNEFIKKGQRLGFLENPKYLKTAAKYINHATGRGHLLGLEGAAVELNAAFFSPRLIMSRLQLINPVFYVRLEKNVRKEALKDLFAFTGLATMVGSLAKMAGLGVETDMRNADFMKLKAGNKRYDILGGLQQVIRTTAQFVSGEIISSTTGKTLTLGEGYKPMTRLGIAGRFLQYKLSPVASFAVTLLTGQATMGGKADIPTEIGRLFVPMAAQDIYEVYNDEGLSAIPLATPAFFGVGLQTYGGVSTYGLTGKNYKTLNTELSRLKTSMGFPSTSVYGQELTGKEYRVFKTEAGKKIARSLESVIRASFYKKANDDGKRHLIDKVIDYTKENVRRKMFKRYRLIQERALGIRKATYKPVQESRQMAEEQIEHILGKE